MIRFIIFSTRLIIAAVIALLFSSCRNEFIGTVGNGNVTTDKRTFTENFTKIESSCGIEVSVEQANTVSVEVLTDENLQKKLITKVVNGTLIIKFEGNISTSNDEKVRIKMPIIDGLSADSSSSITAVNTLKGKDGATLKLIADSSGSIKANIEYDTTKADADSSSDIELSGKTLKLTSNADSAASINAEKLLANEVIAHADSSASIIVHPLVSLTASADSAASIEYTNKPKTISKKEDSSGSVSER